MIGQKSMAMITLKMVPRKDDKMPMPSAREDLPARAMGYPSKQVATDAGVPGMPIRIALTKPPEMPPT